MSPTLTQATFTGCSDRRASATTSCLDCSETTPARFRMPSGKRSVLALGGTAELRGLWLRRQAEAPSEDAIRPPKQPGDVPEALLRVQIDECHVAACPSEPPPRVQRRKRLTYAAFPISKYDRGHVLSPVSGDFVK